MFCIFKVCNSREKVPVLFVRVTSVFYLNITLKIIIFFYWSKIYYYFVVVLKPIQDLNNMCIEKMLVLYITMSVVYYQRLIQLAMSYLILVYLFILTIFFMVVLNFHTT